MEMALTNEMLAEVASGLGVLGDGAGDGELTERIRVLEVLKNAASWCGAPIRHADHVVPAAAGGPTSVANGQGLCEQCNQVKEYPGWRARPGPDDSVTLTTPSGSVHITSPPPLVPPDPVRKPLADLFFRSPRREVCLAA